MNKYRLYYQTEETLKVTKMINIIFLTLESIDKTHVCMFETHADNLDELHANMQRENWTAEQLEINLKHLMEFNITHSSLCVGDIVHDCDTDTFYILTMFGFKEIK